MSRMAEKVVTNAKFDAFLAEMRVAHEGAAKGLGAEHFDAGRFCAMVEWAFADKTKDSSRPSAIRVRDWQREELGKLMVVDAAGRLTSVTWVISWPRRYGKTEFTALYLLLRCLMYPNQVVWVMANSEQQAQSVSFARVAEFLRWSPKCVDSTMRSGGFSCIFDPSCRLVASGQQVKAADRGASKDGVVAQRAADNPFGEKFEPVACCVLANEVRFGNGSSIKVVSSEAASAFGGRLSVVVASELHQARSQEAWDAISGCVGDAWCGVAIIDSTQGDKDNIVARVTNNAEAAARTGGKDGDPTAAASYISYRDIEEACADAPEWLDPRWLRSRAGTMPWASFARQHLNLQIGAGLPCFPEALLDRAQAHEGSGLLCQVDAAGYDGCETSRADFHRLRRLFRGGAVRIENGLDRSLGSSRGDRTVLIASASGVLRGLGGTRVVRWDADGNALGEVEQRASAWAVIAIAFVPYSDGGEIQRIIRRWERLYGAAMQTMETYQSKDLYDWALRCGYEAALEHMTAQAKARHVLRLTEWLHEGRLILPAREDGHCAVLRREFERYSETDASGACPSYGAEPASETFAWPGAVPGAGAGEKTLRIKDDAVEALMWATHQTAMSEAEAEMPPMFFAR